MELLNVFAMIGFVINDLVSIISVLGSLILFVGSFSNAPLKRYGRIADWSIMGLVLGTLFQLSMAITGTSPELIGMVVRMTPLMVSVLLALSFVLLVGRGLIRRSRTHLPEKVAAPNKATRPRMKE